MKFKIGDKVKYNPINWELDFSAEHDFENLTNGVIISISSIKNKYIVNFNYRNDRVFLTIDERNLVANEEKMTDEEIWEMLIPKMKKLGIDPNGDWTSVLYTSNSGTNHVNRSMDMDHVKKLVATVYRSGYGRGQKGRPFVIGEKKNGHWEWIKSDEIVLNGTKVRYMKKSKNDNGDRDCWPELGQECIKATPPGWSENEFWVQYEGTSFEFVCKNSSRNCFQKWVEE